MVGLGRRFQPVEITGVEDPEFYREGGFYPASIGTVMDSTDWRLEHKLGAGGFGTVWLAQDMKSAEKSSDSPSTELFAIKVLTGNASKAESNEAKILRLLKHSSGAGDPDQNKRVVDLIDEFNVTSPNGTHRCLVLGLSGPSALSLSKSLQNGTLEPSLARKVAHQTVQAVAWLHQSGVVHGDLHPGNILLNIEDFGNFPMDKVRDIFGKPIEVALVPFNDHRRDDNAPEKVILPMQLHSVDLQHISGDITIIDFGEAFTVEHPPQFLGTPASYAAPEVLLQTGQYSAAVDLWSLACCIFELRTGQKLFWALVHPIQDVLRRQVELFGLLPRPLWEKWEDRLSWFEEDGTEKKDTPFPAEENSLKEVIQNAAEQMPYLQLDDAEQEELLDLLSSLLKYEPDERADAATVANHPWFQSR
ncbi:hypothetical protein SS1G_13027 [Sclerotinia sclerotiorum 1980 UF-70]|uniref:Protein kinase domain-containing protein n=2 Tax=Sclerotinia sclerotiorum (strain ATCC 18683 / 1980 / Ss-1) TaxID=665079 RepID=A7F5Z9_SCLS1|nr:hypothetical protein SS1G_13027 [Sclerotinia sclerotiorum 1980 UF-70]APA07397.1 hypothetical protein sscle_02g021670 [Sclerotinia sclerotiorum 1980 UF-70]EDN98170.1 hypothetical protein SS1G_13027 [Sclerotinia sclerotiorum 1980 UF-70]